VKKAVHTEKGIFDAVPLLPALPKPNCQVFNSESPIDMPGKSSADKPGLIAETRKNRAQTLASRSSFEKYSEQSRSSTALVGDDDRDIPDKEEDNDSAPTPEPERIITPKKSPNIGRVTDDLIQFTPQNSRRRAASGSTLLTPPQANPFSTNVPTAPPAVAMPTVFGGPTLGLQPFTAHFPPQQAQGFGGQPNMFAPGGFPQQGYGQPTFQQQQGYGQPTFQQQQAFGQFPQPQFGSPQQQMTQQFATFNPFSQPTQQAAAPTFNPFSTGPASPAQNNPFAAPPNNKSSTSLL